jgi:hemerythrin superfamily protein|nr:hemerythrin domain-containing protein [Candidatus Aramenus sulfurataquae]
MWIRKPVDLLYFEHAVLRVRYSIALSLMDNCEEKAIQLLQETHRFVVDWHAKIEDKYFFPLLGDKARPFTNDHLLIEKYGSSAISQRRRDWIERYVKIVLDHNLNEERELFPILSLEDNVLEKIFEEAKAYPNYSSITGLRLED